MSNWVIGCKSCSETFVHFAIADTFLNYFVPQKPEFPAVGDSLECPYCHNKALYQPQI